jgi:hypothetical protein
LAAISATDAETLSHHVAVGELSLDRLLDQVATSDEPGRKLLADAAAMRLFARGFQVC